MAIPPSKIDFPHCDSYITSELLPGPRLHCAERCRRYCPAGWGKSPWRDGPGASVTQWGGDGSQHGVQPFLKMDPCKLASLNLRFRHTFWSLTLQKVWFWCHCVRETHIISHHFLVQALFGLWIWFEIRPRGIEKISGRQLGDLIPKANWSSSIITRLSVERPFGVSGDKGTTKRLAFWRFRRPLELQKESRMRASNSSSTLLGENVIWMEHPKKWQYP